MAYIQVPQYNILTDFSQDEAGALSGRSTVRTFKLDNEFVNIKSVLDALRNNLGLVLRSDGTLALGTVTVDALAQDVLDLISGGNASYILADGSVAFTGDQSMGDNKLTNLAAPTAPADAATKQYVDDSIAGISSVDGGTF